MRHGLGPLLGVRQLHDLIFDIFDFLNLKSLGKETWGSKPGQRFALGRSQQACAKQRTKCSKRRDCSQPKIAAGNFMSFRVRLARVNMSTYNSFSDEAADKVKCSKSVRGHADTGQVALSNVSDLRYLLPII